MESTNTKSKDGCTSGDHPASETCMFTEGEKVLAYHDSCYYEAKIQKAEVREEEWRYFIHYLGWSKKWDEWVGIDCLLKHTKEYFLKHQSLDKRQDAERTTMSGCSTRPKPNNSIVAKQKRQKTDSGNQKDNLAVGKVVKIKIPSTLKKQLVDDWEFITQQGKFVKLPRSPTVDDILTKYLEYSAEKDGMITDSVGEILKGLRCYFDKALPMMLLYKKERQQYHEAVVDNVSPSTIYGAEHLLRLFVNLPKLMSYVNIPEETLARVQQHLSDFINFLQKNQSDFFDSAYSGETKSSEETDNEKLSA